MNIVLIYQLISYSEIKEYSNSNLHQIKRCYMCGEKIISCSFHKGTKHEFLFRI